MQLYTDLYFSDNNRKKMLGLDDFINKPNLKIDSEYVYIPLKFWFCLDYYNPLPVLALQYSEIYIDVTFNEFNNCICILQYNLQKTKLFHSNLMHQEMPIEDSFLQANFYCLDSNDRILISNKNYEILILQSQLRSINLNMHTGTLNLDFNNIVKDILFFIQPINHKLYGEYFNFSARMTYLPVELYDTDINLNLWELEPKKHLLVKARLLFNSNERIGWRDYKYFYFMQNHENYRTNIHSYIYMYSFATNPKITNIMGCNFSGIDNPQLQIEIKPNVFFLNEESNIKYPVNNNYEFKCYATNYNILVIKNGLGSLKYIN